MMEEQEVFGVRNVMDEELAMPAVIMVVPSSVTEEITSDQLCDPLAVDPLGIAHLHRLDLNVRKKVKRETISGETEEEDPLKDIPNEYVHLSKFHPDKAVSRKSEILTMNELEEDPLKDIPNESAHPSKVHPDKTVSLKSELLTVHELEEDPLKDIPNESVLPNKVQSNKTVSHKSEILTMNELEGDPLKDIPNESVQSSKVHSGETVSLKSELLTVNELEGDPLKDIPNEYVHPSKVHPDKTVSLKSELLTVNELEEDHLNVIPNESEQPRNVHPEKTVPLKLEVLTADELEEDHLNVIQEEGHLDVIPNESVQPSNIHPEKTVPLKLEVLTADELEEDHLNVIPNESVQPCNVHPEKTVPLKLEVLTTDELEEDHLNVIPNDSVQPSTAQPDQTVPLKSEVLTADELEEDTLQDSPDEDVALSELHPEEVMSYSEDEDTLQDTPDEYVLPSQSHPEDVVSCSKKDDQQDISSISVSEVNSVEKETSIQKTQVTELGPACENESRNAPSNSVRDEGQIEKPGSSSEDTRQNQGLSAESASTGRQTRRSAVAALAAIHRSTVSEVTLSDSSESEDADIDEDYQMSSEDDSEKETNTSGIQHATKALTPCGNDRNCLPNTPGTKDQEISCHSRSQDTESNKLGQNIQKIQQNIIHLIESLNNRITADSASTVRHVVVQRDELEKHSTDCEEIKSGVQQSFNTPAPSVYHSRSGRSDIIQGRKYFSELKPSLGTNVEKCKTNSADNIPFEEQEVTTQVNKVQSVESKDLSTISCTTNNHQKVINKRDCTKIIIHPMSGLLVSQIFDSTLIGNSTGRGNSNFLYSCLKCRKHFAPEVYKQTHGAAIEGHKHLFKCHICKEKMFLHHQLSMHLHIHERVEGKRGSCPICNKVLSSRKCLEHHMNTVHSTSRPYECEVCSKTFKSSGCLKSHMKVHSNERPFKCSVCGKTFKFHSGFRRHTAIHTGGNMLLCHVCGRMCNDEKFKGHLNIHFLVTPFQCEICDKCYASRRMLTQHIRHSHGRVPIFKTLVCEVCGKKVKGAHGLHEHMNIHAGIKPYSCDVCGKSFHKKSTLLIHVQTHSIEKRYKCDICGFACHRLDNLTTHMRSHTGEKPFSCSLCNKTFARQDNLLSHKRRAHKIASGDTQSK